MPKSIVGVSPHLSSERDELFQSVCDLHAKSKHLSTKRLQEEEAADYKLIEKLGHEAANAKGTRLFQARLWKLERKCKAYLQRYKSHLR